MSMSHQHEPPMNLGSCRRQRSCWTVGSMFFRCRPFLTVDICYTYIYIHKWEGVSIHWRVLITNTISHLMVCELTYHIHGKGTWSSKPSSKKLSINLEQCKTVESQAYQWLIKGIPILILHDPITSFALGDITSLTHGIFFFVLTGPGPCWQWQKLVAMVTHFQGFPLSGASAIEWWIFSGELDRYCLMEEIMRFPVEVDSLSHYLRGFIMYTTQVVVWDFWTINRYHAIFQVEKTQPVPLEKSPKSFLISDTIIYGFSTRWPDWPHGFTPEKWWC